MAKSYRKVPPDENMFCNLLLNTFLCLMIQKPETLYDALSNHFPMNASRLDTFEAVTRGLILTSTVNLKRISGTIPGNSQEESKYSRVLNFIAEVEFDYELFAVFVISFLNVSSKSWVLALDRTSWNYGESGINILVLSIIHKGSAVPLFWELLPKKGASNTEERQEIILQLLKRFPPNKIEGILCDREFIGDDWLEFLSSCEIPFYIRIRKDIKIYCHRGKCLNKGIKRLSHGCRLEADGLSKIGGAQVSNLSVAALRLHKADELLIVVTNANPKKALELYAKRWGIEVLFENLKSRGFNFEDTHLTDPCKIKKMLGLLTVATCWAQKTGEWEETKKPTKIKAHGRRAQSIFRRGLDKLRTVFYNINDSLEAFHELLALFPPPSIALRDPMQSPLNSVT